MDLTNSSALELRRWRQATSAPRSVSSGGHARVPDRVRARVRYRAGAAPAAWLGSPRGLRGRVLAARRHARRIRSERPGLDLRTLRRRVHWARGVAATWHRAAAMAAASDAISVARA